nr:EpsG family protein [Vibrio breoganii]
MSPILGLASSTLYVLNKKLNVFVISASLALILCYFPLMYDVSHSFYEYYDNLSNGIDSQLHIINIIANYFKNNLNLDYFYTVFFVCFISLFLWFSVYKNIVVKVQSRQLFVSLFLIFIFALSYKEVMDINRTFFSFTVAMYAIYSREKSKFEFNRVAYVFLMIISVTIHPSAIVLLLCYILGLNTVLSRNKIVIAAFVAVMLGLSVGYLLQTVVRYVPPSPVYNYLVSEKWGLVSSVEIGHALLWTLQISIVMTLLLIVSTQRVISNLSATFFYMAIFFLVMFKFRIFGERYFIAIILFIPFVLDNEYKLRNQVRILVFLMFAKFFVYNIYLFGYIFTPKYSYVIKSQIIREELIVKPFILPTTALVLFNQYGYSDELIKNNSTRRE